MSTIVRFVPEHRITALVLEGTSPLDLGAVAEVFGIDRGLATNWYDFSVCGPRRGRLGTRGGLRLSVDRGLDELATADTILVLPIARFVRERPGEQVLAALKAAADRGTRIASLCLGTFIVAATGILDGRRATTHWALCPALRETFPKVEVVPDVLYLDEGNVLTSGGVAAGIDLCLHLVRNDHGAEIANRLARLLVFGPHREGGQAQFIEQPVPDPGQHSLGPALSWALERLSENPTIDQFAHAAAMSRRTFYREFQTSTGTTPQRWLTAQRVLLARCLLETTQLAVEEIARQAGFGDTSQLRRHFTARTGLSPTAYRLTFGHPHIR
jgi:transcriptional regulator GlxA family with amidase domain